MSFRAGWLVLLLVMLLTPCDAGGQTTEVGIVSRIKDHERDVPSTQRAQLWRVGEGGPIHRELPLRNHDIIRLGQQVFLDLGFFGEDIESRAILGTRSLSAQGAYTVQENTVDDIGGLELVVRQGVMVVEHVRGRLTTVAAGVRTRIFGTTVLLSVNEDGNEAHFYLPEGSVGFTQWTDLAFVEAGANGRAWRLREGERPEELLITAQMRDRWRDEVRYNSTQVWQTTPTPFWQKPQFYVPAALVVAGTAVLVLTSGGSDRVRGQVVATFPN
jgi:hypothetical protein